MFRIARPLLASSGHPCLFDELPLCLRKRTCVDGLRYVPHFHPFRVLKYLGPTVETIIELGPDRGPENRNPAFLLSPTEGLWPFHIQLKQKAIDPDILQTQAGVIFFYHMNRTKPCGGLCWLCLRKLNPKVPIVG